MNMVPTVTETETIVVPDEVLTEEEFFVQQKGLVDSAIRQKIFSRSELLYENVVNNGTKFVVSKTTPTQVINTTVGRYIRINQNDINPENVNDLLSIMLGLSHYSYLEGDEATFNPTELIKQSIALNERMDGKFIDSTTTDLISFDTFGEIDNIDNLPIKPQVIKVATTTTSKTEYETCEVPAEGSGDTADDTLDELEDDTEEAGASTGSMMSAMEESGTSEQDNKKAMMDLSLEQSLENVATVKNKSRFHKSTSVLTVEDLKKLQPKVNQLLKAFKGTKSRNKKTTPAKRISPKDVGLDREKIYVSTTDDKGKHIKLNLLIDMSGSMSGTPVKNAVRLVWLFNQLAKEGYVTMSVFYSDSSNNYALKLPADDSEILALCSTGSSEGLARTVKAHQEALKGINCICITDGDIVDEPIDKAFWSKNHIVATGVYVNKSVKEYLTYSESMNKWFNYSIVRKNIDDLIEWLIRVGLKG